MDAEGRVRLDAQSPFPGLLAFDEESAPFFHGREREADELLSLVEQRTLTVLYGISGLGKTSLLQAGLFPRLRRVGLVPIHVRLLFGEREEPLLDQIRTRFTRAMDKGELEGAAPRKDETLWSYFHTTGFWDDEGQPVTPVLVMDQFEEVFTLGRGREAELQTLLEQLADVVHNRIPASVERAVEAGKAELPRSYEKPAAKVLLSLREDFLAQLKDLRRVLPALEIDGYRLRPLDGKAAFEAVREPGRAILSDDVAKHIVCAVAGVADTTPVEQIREVEPALLALYCQELSLARKDPGEKIDGALFEAKKAEILDTFYDRCMKGMSDAAHRFVEIELLNDQHRRDMKPLSRVAEFDVSEVEIGNLISRRLLRSETRLGDEKYVEIVHDVLTETIGRRRVLRKRSEEQQRLEAERKRREEELERRAERAEEAERQRQVEAEKRLAEEEKNRLRRRTWMLVGGILAVIAVAVALFSVREVQNRRDAEEERTRARNHDRLKFDHARASELANLAWRATAERRWDDAARLLAPAYDALADAQEIQALSPEGGEPPGEALALLSLLGCRFEATAGRVESLFTDPGGIDTFRVTRDGSYGVVLGADGRSVNVVDLESRRTWRADLPGRAPNPDERATLKKLFEPIDWFSGAVRALTVSGDASVIFGQGQDGQVVAWRTYDGQRRLGLRTQLTGGRIYPDRTGSHLLFWDSNDDRALVATLDPRGGAVRSVVELDGSSSAQKGDDPGGYWSMMQLSQDGTRVVAVSVRAKRADPGGAAPRFDARDTELQLIDTASGKKIDVEKEDVPSESVLLSPDGALAVTIGRDRQVRVRSIADGKIGAPTKVSAGVSSTAWLGFPNASRSLLIGTERALALWNLADAARPKQIWELPLGSSLRSAEVSDDGAEALVSLGEEVRLYDVQQQRLRAVVPLPELSMGRAPQLRARGSKRQVLTASEKTLQLRSLDELAGDGPRDGGGPAPSLDRYLANERARTKALLAISLPQVGFVSDARGGANELSVLSRGSAWIVGGLDKVAAKDPRAALELHAWAKPETSYLRAFRLSGGRVAAIDTAGIVYFGDDKGPENQSLLRAFTKGDGDQRALLALSADGRWAATAGWSQFVFAWDTASGRLAWSADVRRENNRSPFAKPNVAVTAIAIATLAGPGGKPTGPVTFVGDEKGGVRAQITAGPGARRDIKWITLPFAESPHKDAVRAIAAGPGERLASAAADGTLALWKRDGDKGYKLTASSLHNGGAQALEFAEKGALLVSGGTDRVARVWSAEGAPKCVMDGHTDSVVALDVEPGPGKRVLSVDDDGTAILWTASTCEQLNAWRGVAHAGFVGEATDRVVTVSRSGRIEIWDALGVSSSVNSVWGAFSEGSTLLAGSDEGVLLQIVTDSTAQPVSTTGGAPRGAPVSASAAGHVIAVLPDGKLRAWDRGASSEGALDMQGGWSVRAVALSPEGAQVLSLEEGPESRLRHRIFPWNHWQSASATVELVTGEGCGVAVKGGNVDHGASSEGVFVASWTKALGPRMLAVDGKGCVRLRGADGKPVIETLGPGAADSTGRSTAVALSPNGKRLILGSEDGAISIWEAQPPRLRRIALEQRRHVGRVRAIAFHPDGRFAVTAGDDGQAWLWDADEAHAIARLGTHPAPIRWAAFRPDGNEVVTGGADRWIRAWATRTTLSDAKPMIGILRSWLPELAKAP